MKRISINDQVKLFVTSEVPIYKVFSEDGETKKEISDHQRSVMDDLVRLPDHLL